MNSCMAAARKAPAVRCATPSVGSHVSPEYESQMKPVHVNVLCQRGLKGAWGGGGLFSKFDEGENDIARVASWSRRWLCKTWTAYLIILDEVCTWYNRDMNELARGTNYLTKCRSSDGVRIGT